MPLSFLDELDDAQVDAANKIASKAKELGVDPKLAVAMAYAESRLRMNTGDSKKGAIGVMQITPATGQDMKLSEEDLRNPDVNIDAGVRILKKHLNKYPDDPRLALVAYNYGPSSDFFSGGELPAETKKYIKDVIGYGGLANFGVNQTSTTTDEGVAPEQAPVSEPTPSQAPQFEQDSNYSLTPPPPPPAPEPGKATPAEIKERMDAAVMGGLTGLGVTGVIGSGGILQRAGKAFGKGLLEGSKPAGTLESVAPAENPPGVLGEAQFEQAPKGPYRGKMPRNYGVSAGLSDIEAQQALDMTKNEGGVHDIINKRNKNVNTIKSLDFGKRMAEVSPEIPIWAPKEPYKPPKPPGALERVTGVFQSLINNPVTRFAGKFRGLTPPLAFAGGFERGAEALQELRKPNTDWTSTLLKGGSAVGQLITPFQPEFGIPITGLSEGALYLRGNSPNGVFSFENPNGKPVQPKPNQVKPVQ
jgi:hypothetical protein